MNRRSSTDSPERQIALIRAGMPYPAFCRARAALGLTPIELTALKIDDRNLRRRRSARLTHAETERFLGLERVLRRAADILGHKAVALEWLRTPAQALEGATPLSLVDLDVGREQILEVLERLEDSIVA